ncbi:MAG: hypothetical protein MZW92_56395 [Comamonadaceae bacterium]|nr:hypothetical protein [Comamonadaceae bacterium]
MPLDRSIHARRSRRCVDLGRPPDPADGRRPTPDGAPAGCRTVDLGTAAPRSTRRPPAAASAAGRPPDSPTGSAPTLRPGAPRVQPRTLRARRPPAARPSVLPGSARRPRARGRRRGGRLPGRARHRRRRAAVGRPRATRRRRARAHPADARTDSRRPRRRHAGAGAAARAAAGRAAARSKRRAGGVPVTATTTAPSPRRRTLCARTQSEHRRQRGPRSARSAGQKATVSLRAAEAALAQGDFAGAESRRSRTARGARPLGPAAPAELAARLGAAAASRPQQVGRRPRSASGSLASDLLNAGQADGRMHAQALRAAIAALRPRARASTTRRTPAAQLARRAQSATATAAESSARAGRSRCVPAVVAGPTSSRSGDRAGRRPGRPASRTRPASR